MSTLEPILNLFFDGLWTESKRYARIKAYTVAVAGVRGSRLIVMRLFRASMAFVLLIGSFFALIVHEVNRFEVTGKFVVDPFTMISLALMILSLLVMFWTTREEGWLSAFRLNDVRKKVRRPLDDEDETAPSFDEERLALLLDRVVEKRMSQFRTSAPQMPTQAPA